MVSIGWGNGNGVIPLFMGGGKSAPPISGGIYYMTCTIHVHGSACMWQVCGTVQALSISSHSHLPYTPTPSHIHCT